MNRRATAQVPRKETLTGRPECRGLLGSALRKDTYKGVKAAALDRGKSSTKGLGQAHGELWSWAGLSEISPVEVRGLDFAPPHQPVITLGETAPCS